jgi:hypothetical protein
MSNRQHNDRFHGRVGNGTARCAYPGCGEAGDFRAPSSHGRRGGSDGPGEYQLLCLDHVREFNAGYDWFAGMSAEQIAAAQSPTYTWPNETRAFSAAASVDAPPKWQDFNDPLDAIMARYKRGENGASQKMRTDGMILHPQDRKALKTLGLGEDADRKILRRRYSELVRKYHPDKNGGNRAHEKALQDVIAAYTHLKNTPIFT